MLVMEGSGSANTIIKDPDVPKLTNPDPQHWKRSAFLYRNDKQFERKKGN
jgi:hypothetical protein